MIGQSSIIRPVGFFLLLAAAFTLLSSCATEEDHLSQNQKFGEPESTIPWNRPQGWETGAGPLGAIAGEGR